MSWICNIDAEPINLDDVRKIIVLELDENDEGHTHGVFARSMQDADDDEPSYCLFTGSEQEAYNLLSKLKDKLPMVKL